MSQAMLRHGRRLGSHRRPGQIHLARLDNLNEVIIDLLMPDALVPMRLTPYHVPDIAFHKGERLIDSNNDRMSVRFNELVRYLKLNGFSHAQLGTRTHPDHKSLSSVRLVALRGKTVSNYPVHEVLELIRQVAIDDLNLIGSGTISLHKSLDFRHRILMVGLCHVCCGTPIQQVRVAKESIVLEEVL
jgi:hypothetical protein